MSKSEYTKQVVDPALVLDSKVLEDNSVRDAQFVSYPPTSQTSIEGSSGVITCHINQTDQFYQLSESYVRVQLKISNAGTNLDHANKSGRVPLAHNGFWHLFDAIRLQVNGQDVERIEEPGHTLTMLQNALATTDDAERSLDTTFCPDSSYRLSDGPGLALNLNDNLASGETASKSEGWAKRLQYLNRYTASSDACGTVSLIIPLKWFMGFARDYKKVLYGMSFSLIFSRKDQATASRLAVQSEDLTTGGSTADNTIANPRVEIKSFDWVVKVLHPSVEVQDKLYQRIKHRAEYPIVYRRIRTAEYDVPASTSMSWNAASVQVANEQPLYAMLAFQRKVRTSGNDVNLVAQNASMFDFANVKDISVHINGFRVPNEIRDYDFSAGQFWESYHDFTTFKHKFLGIPMGSKSPFDIYDFGLFSPVHVIDLTQSVPESIRQSTTNITVKVSFKSDPGTNYKLYMNLITRDTLVARSDGSRFSLLSM